MKIVSNEYFQSASRHFWSYSVAALNNFKFYIFESKLIISIEAEFTRYKGLWKNQ